jgi:hypothetical protein
VGAAPCHLTDSASIEAVSTLNAPSLSAASRRRRLYDVPFVGEKRAGKGRIRGGTWVILNDRRAANTAQAPHF